LDVAVSIEGCLAGGGRFRAPLAVRVLGTTTSGRSGVKPNPLNPSGRLFYSTSRPGPVKIRVFDLSGRLLSTLLDEALVPEGDYEVPIRGESLRAGSGVYFYRIDAVDGTSTGRFTILK
jgi:hypothetical protein